MGADDFKVGIKNPVTDTKKSPAELEKIALDLVAQLQQKGLKNDIASTLNEIAQGVGASNPDKIAKLVESVNEQTKALDPQQKGDVFKKVFDLMTKDVVKGTGATDESTPIAPKAPLQAFRKALEALGDSRADLKMGQITLNTIFAATKTEKGASGHLSERTAADKDAKLHEAYLTNTVETTSGLSIGQQKTLAKQLDKQTASLFAQSQVSTFKGSTPPPVFRIDHNID